MSSEVNRIVSSESEQLILVSPDDEELGYLSKLECHDGAGALHRAFSLFIFNRRGELLLQRRAAGKRLWPMFWSNSCCSHPRKGETMEQATSRRLLDELNMRAELEFIYKFSYQVSFGERGAENELCWVYLGRSDDPPAPNDTEIAASRFVSAALLRQEMSTDPGQFTPWFRMEWQRLLSEFGERLAAFTAGDGPANAQPT